MSTSPQSPEEGLLLAKIRPSSQLFAASSRIDLEPLYAAPARPAGSPFAVDGEAQWYVMRGEPSDSPWDQAHARIAGQLGIDESDVLFVEPDLVHDIFDEGTAAGSHADDIGGAFGVGEQCVPIDQDPSNGKPVGPQFAWHLEDAFSQLRRARTEVPFTGTPTRIAHLDTGYYPAHQTTPNPINTALQRNFVRGDADPASAADPDNNLLVLDNSGHGTGTLGILAGGPVTGMGDGPLGGANGADVVPIRVADSVVLLRTSSLARAIRYAADIDCAVATLSMGGLPTKAWAEAVDEAYLLGLCLCAAAGNHPGPLPPKNVVYPARYDRVIAVAGVMADGKPYTGLKGSTLEGSFGPDSVMKYALAAYTPNIPWAKFGCSDIVRLNGEGTSSATPQVAAAATLWIEKYKDRLPRSWRRVEAVRFALFSTAKTKSDKKHFGNGIVQAQKALSVAPNLQLPQSNKSKNSWAFLRLATGIGIREASTREEMFNLELAQRWLLNETLQDLVPDPDATGELSEPQMKQVLEALIEDDGASVALRRHIVARYPLVAGTRPPVTKSLRRISPDLPDVSIDEPEIPTPANRRLRVYAMDPSLATRLATSTIGEITLDVPWESLKRNRYGFEGEYLKVNDTKPAGGGYRGANLSDERLLAQDGWQPSEGNAQFHQQMVYAVASKTVEHFERALGRPVQWRPAPKPDQPNDDSTFVRQLEIRPHALEVANAYYSPDEVALLFGYFAAPEGGDQLPGSLVYTCLSHEVIAHETTHAVLDGMYRRFNEPSNLDVLAFHEGFADLVALLQHFAIPDLLEHEILKSRGDLETDTLLGKLAIQLGKTARGSDSLRTAIGSVEAGTWKRALPDKGELAGKTTPHARGAVLVGAVFDAMLAIYSSRTADLLRIASGGTGRLPDGAIHPDLARRLANEAAKSASHVLGMCIRALDYLPPVDVTFFDFLRALITADYELVNDDRHNYRVAFVEAFSRRAIFPGDHDEQIHEGPIAFSADTLRWPGFDEGHVRAGSRERVMKEYAKIVAKLRSYADECLYISDRQQLFDVTRTHRAILHGMLKKSFGEVPEFADSLGLSEGTFEVHALRRALRARVDGRVTPEVILSLTQSTGVAADATTDMPAYKFRGGSTLVLDLTKPDLPKYRIVKHIGQKDRRAAAGTFAADIARDPLRRIFFSAAEPFAALHQLVDE